MIKFPILSNFYCYKGVFAFKACHRHECDIEVEVEKGWRFLFLLCCSFMRVS